VLKPNGGMGSTYNCGFLASRGEVIVLLDSDDFLLPDAAASAADALSRSGVAKAHWPLRVVDDRGRATGDLIPQRPLAQGDLRERMLADGPDSYLSPPTSGNAWSRAFLADVLPLPEPAYRRHADSYLTTLAPIFGAVARIATPQACYRLHGANDYACQPSDEKSRRNLEIYEHRCAALRGYLKAKGLHAEPDAWTSSNPHYRWLQRFVAAAEAIKAVVPVGSTYVLVDEDSWGDHWGGSEILAGRRHIPFLERDQQYWGPPPDDATAVRELERLRGGGASFIVIGWPAFWWLDHYTAFNDYLRASYRCVLASDSAIVFDLQRTLAEERA
jgi:glycosyltransferase involved in cell wall biosynthesis